MHRWKAWTLVNGGLTVGSFDEPIRLCVSQTQTIRVLNLAHTALSKHEALAMRTQDQLEDTDVDVARPWCAFWH